MYNSITEIESYAFDGCSMLRTVFLGSNMQKIGEKAFLAICYASETRKGGGLISLEPKVGKQSEQCQRDQDAEDIKCPSPIG
jgi:hypothetical protein